MSYESDTGTGVLRDFNHNFNMAPALTLRESELLVAVAQEMKESPKVCVLMAF